VQNFDALDIEEIEQCAHAENCGTLPTAIPAALSAYGSGLTTPMPRIAHESHSPALYNELVYVRHPADAVRETT